MALAVGNVLADGQVLGASQAALDGLLVGQSDPSI